MIGTTVTASTMVSLMGNMSLELPVTVMFFGPMAELATEVTRELLARTSGVLHGLIMMRSGMAGMIVATLVIMVPIVLTTIASFATIRATPDGGELLVLRL